MSIIAGVLDKLKSICPTISKCILALQCKLGGLRVALQCNNVKLENLLMEIKRISELTASDLNRKVTLDIGFDQKESGILTDFYGAMDSETHAVIAIEFDHNLTFYLSPSSEVELD
jgi:hypothetical protein